MSEDTSAGAGWQRWQLAVAIGVPVTLATGCVLYYFWSRNTSSGSHDPINKTTAQDAQASVSRCVCACVCLSVSVRVSVSLCLYACLSVAETNTKCSLKDFGT